jgi:GH18 family chitinase
MARLDHVTHVALAFMPSSLFNDPARSEWPIFESVEATRARFRPTTRIMVAIGGWGDTEGFAKAARSEASRALFAENVARMVVQTGADGEESLSLSRP